MIPNLEVNYFLGAQREANYWLSRYHDSLKQFAVTPMKEYSIMLVEVGIEINPGEGTFGEKSIGREESPAKNKKSNKMKLEGENVFFLFDARNWLSGSHWLNNEHVIWSQLACKNQFFSNAIVAFLLHLQRIGLLASH